MSSSAAKPVVSVVVPLYNTEKYVVECIGSVLDQSLSEWEVLVIDDGSRDRSAQVVEKIASRDRRVRLLRHPGGVNLGVSRTRRLGIMEASGDYIAFLDADDAFEPSKLERQVSLMKSHLDCVLCHTGIRAVTVLVNDPEQSRLLESEAERHSNHWNRFLAEMTEYSYLDRHDALRYSYICNSSVLARTSAVQSRPPRHRNFSSTRIGAMDRALVQGVVHLYTGTADPLSFPHRVLVISDLPGLPETPLFVDRVPLDPLRPHRRHRAQESGESELLYDLARIAAIYADRGTGEAATHPSLSPQPPVQIEESFWEHSVIQLQSQVDDLNAQVKTLSDRLTKIRSSKVYQGLVRLRNLLNKIRLKSSLS